MAAAGDAYQSLLTEPADVSSRLQAKRGAAAHLLQHRAEG